MVGFTEPATPKGVEIEPEAIGPPNGPGNVQTAEEFTARGTRADGLAPDLATAGNLDVVRFPLKKIINPGRSLCDRYKSGVSALRTGTWFTTWIFEEGSILQEETNQTDTCKIPAVHKDSIQGRGAPESA